MDRGRNFRRKSLALLLDRRCFPFLFYSSHNFYLHSWVNKRFDSPKTVLATKSKLFCNVAFDGTWGEGA